MGKLTPFSDDEIATIQAAFWQESILREFGEGEVPCPSCGSDCRVVLSKTTRFPRQLMATCDACSRHSQFRATEAPGPDLDEAATREFVLRHQGGLESICSYCSTPIDLRETRVLMGELVYHVICRRCGSSGQLRWR